MRTVLQVPMTKALRARAERAATREGFSSLQEVVRVFLNKLSAGGLTVGIGERSVNLSKKAEKRYLDMDKDFRSGKNIYKAHDVNDLMQQLDAS